jgi:peptidoglycan/xylan/chitin deacetylase (PgdA/CDA1 family)
MAKQTLEPVSRSWTTRRDEKRRRMQLIQPWMKGPILPKEKIIEALEISRRRMMSISTHDRISGVPGRVKLLEEFIKYAQKQKGVVFMRKDEIAKWALSASNVPHET